MLPALAEMKRKYPVIGDVRGRGAMIAIELVVPGTKDPNPAAVSDIIKFCQQEGVLVLSAGTYGNVLRFLPPLVMPEDLLLEALEIIEKALASLA
jgi:4-aminobutyrate aminotransferase/(S)-3-amino-2-methylpropionate transaminase